MNRSGLVRFAPLTGVAFIVLLVAGRLIGVGAGSYPDADASAAKAVSFWADHDGEEMAVAFIDSLSALFLVWFAGSLRETLWRSEGGSGRLATIGFGGAIIAAAGILIEAFLVFVAADTAAHVPPQVTQTLSALQADFFLPFSIGFGLLGLSSGVAMLRTGVMPRWLGWTAVVMGFLWLTPGSIVALLLMVVWVIAVSVRLYQRQEPDAAEPIEAPAAGRG